MSSPDSPGEKAGLKAGDKILEVDGKPVTRFSGMNDSVTWNVIRSEGDTIPFVVERDGQRLCLSVVPYTRRDSGWRRKSVRQVLIYPATTPMIEQVEAGLARGRRRAAAGRCHPRIQRPADVQRRSRWRISFEQHPHEELKLDVQRGSRPVRDCAASGCPMMTRGKMMPRIGIAWDTTGQDDDRAPESDRAGLRQRHEHA